MGKVVMKITILKQQKQTSNPKGQTKISTYLNPTDVLRLRY